MALILLILLCLVFAGLCSGSEMGFVSCNRMRLRHEADTGDKRSQAILRLRNTPKEFLASLLIGTNLAYVSATSLLTYFVKSRFAVENELLITVILAPIVIIFTETIPKDLFRRNADRFMRSLAFPLLCFFYILGPVARVLIAISDFLTSPFKPRAGKPNPFVTEQELRSLVAESVGRGIIQPEEKVLIDRVIDFERIQVGQMMRPLKDVTWIKMSKTVRWVKEELRRHKRSLFLVYDEDPSNIVGILKAMDIIFEGDEDKEIQPFLRTPLFLSQNASCEEAFRRLQERHLRVAVVLDQEDKPTGFVEIVDLIKV